MPAFKGILNDADIAAIINHERTTWGNVAPIVDAADVARLRK
jgi:cytochrome c oxidase cbb3-type subunit 2